MSKTFRAFVLCIVGIPPCWGAFGARSTWEVRTTGATTNGGAFDPGVASPGTDFSQQNGPQVQFTDLVIGGTTTQGTSVAHPFDSTYPGNFINIASGAGCTVQTVEVLSVSGVTATFDKSLGTGASTCSGDMGGARSTLAAVALLVVAGNTVWVKATATYSIAASATLAVSGSAALPIQWIGYTTTRGDNGRPTIQASAGLGATGVVTISGNYNRLMHFILDGNSQTTTRGLNQTGTFDYMLDISVIRWTSTGISNTGNDYIVESSSSVGGTGGTNGFNTSATGIVRDCFASGGAGSGFGQTAGRSHYIRCIAYNNTLDGFTNSAATQFAVLNCAAHTNARDGFRCTGAGSCDGATIRNSIFYGNTGIGINSVTNDWSVGGATLDMDYNAVGANGTARVGVPTGAHDVTLTADPVVSASGGNFALNSTSGGGLLLKNAGYPGLFVGPTSTTGYSDIGAVPKQSPGVAVGSVQ